MDKDTVIFGSKTFANLIEDVYQNQKHKSSKIDKIINDFLKQIATTPSTIAIYGPVIKDCLDVSVKNDELLVKLTGILQRLISNNSISGDNEFGLTDLEREDLIKEIKSLSKSDTTVNV